MYRWNGVRLDVYVIYMDWRGGGRAGQVRDGWRVRIGI